MVLVALGIGIAVLARMGGGSHIASATSPTSTTIAGSPTSSTQVPSTLPATTTTTVPPANVTVLVLNGSTTEHAALYFQVKLAGAGYDTRSPTDASTDNNASTKVFVVEPTAQPNAESIAQLIGASSSSVVTPTAANDAAIPVADVHAADIIVVVGADISTQVPPNYNGTTTTAPSSAAAATTTTAAV